MEAKAALALWAAWIAGLVAQADPAGGPLAGWMSVVIQFGSFGLIAYLIVQGLPGLQKEIQAERKAERGDFMAALERLSSGRDRERADFSQAITNISAAARLENEKLRAAFAEEQKQTRECHAVQMAAMQKLYVDVVGSMRTAVHDVKDAAGVAVNKAAVAAEVARQAIAGT